MVSYLRKQIVLGFHNPKITSREEGKSTEKEKQEETGRLLRENCRSTQVYIFNNCSLKV
jgi:hypothetical protein